MWFEKPQGGLHFAAMYISRTVYPFEFSVKTRFVNICFYRFYRLLQIYYLASCIFRIIHNSNFSIVQPQTSKVWQLLDNAVVKSNTVFYTVLACQLTPSLQLEFTVIRHRPTVIHKSSTCHTWFTSIIAHYTKRIESHINLIRSE